MFAVIVTFEIHPGRVEDFMPLMAANAATSLAQEPDCLQFDICTDPDRPNEVFLYETYTDKAAFAAHMKSAHFLEFDAEAAPLIARKTVKTYRQVLA